MLPDSHRVFVGVLLVFSAVMSGSQAPPSGGPLVLPLMGHSHNDEAKPTPLVGALAAGLQSIEVDW
ncbi:hypothetical protein HaLaN_13987 [Haematococcus lacustris]|uniref:Glycerophosphodiester phosphodiesterase n=1 Tax=Haematococcus lacustris TaxID=44745 RepID=A0A699ZEQ1_HAELA|nr:hypothetical protein HaLaN_13987 [Haematococcus lacustris]